MRKYTKSEMDQVASLARDTLPYFWKAIYQGSVEAGFGEDQAMHRQSPDD
jgi:hypothetical protein